MTERQLRALLAAWQKRLGLEAYRVKLCIVAAETIGSDGDEEWWGKLTADPSRLAATITLAGLRPAAEVEATLAHECVHLAVADLREQGREVADLIGQVAGEVWRVEWERNEEALVTRLERALTGT